jgi:holin-like protein
MKILVQCGILFGICVAGDAISALTHLPIPGNVIGMAILFLLLCTGILKKTQIDRISDFFLGNMAFFFIPSGVAIIVYYKALEKAIVPFLLIILFTTIIVMAVTGQCAQLLQKLGGKNNKRGHSDGRRAENTIRDDVIKV